MTEPYIDRIEYPTEAIQRVTAVVEAARSLDKLIGGAELAKITEATGSMDILKAIVRVKARVQELYARAERGEDDPDRTSKLK